MQESEESANTHSHRQAHIHTYAHTYMHTHSYTHTHTYTHTSGSRKIKSFVNINPTISLVFLP